MLDIMKLRFTWDGSMLTFQFRTWGMSLEGVNLTILCLLSIIILVCVIWSLVEDSNNFVLQKFIHAGIAIFCDSENIQRWYSWKPRK
jgi:putative flippase GtrA